MGVALLVLLASPPAFELTLINPDGSPAEGVSVVTNVLTREKGFERRGVRTTDAAGTVTFATPRPTRSWFPSTDAAS